MAELRKPQSPPQNNKQEFDKFSDALKHFMARKKLSQAALSTASGISKPTITRIIKNKDYRGSNYVPTIGTVYTLAIAMRLTEDERDTLLYAALPEIAIWQKAIKHGWSLVETNIELDALGYPLLRQPIE